MERGRGLGGAGAMMSEPVSVIINVFNEAPTIEAEIRDIHATIVSRLPGSQLIVAEDGSTDGTKEIIARLIGELGIVHSTSPQRKGYARALRDAMGLAACPWIFFSDTGGKNDFADFWKLYEARQGAALVIGGRLGRGDQLYRRLLSWGYGQLLRVYFGLPRLDADSGFRLYETSLAKALAGQEWINSQLIASELVLRIHAMGGEIRQLPVTYRRRQGASRGLPAKNIPAVVLGIVRNMPALKRACARLRSAR